MDIKLREIAREDLPLINQWRNDQEVVSFLGANFQFINEDVDQKWFDQYLANRNSQVRLSIVLSANGQHIGNVNLTSVHSINRSAEFSIVIGDKNYWSGGLGSKATKMMLEHGFKNLNLNRIYLFVLADNDRAKKVYSNLGFKTEGVMKQATYKQGCFCDLEVMALLAQDFK